MIGGGGIQRIVHQIWFGRGDPSYRKHFFNHTRALCNKLGFMYILWTENDRTEANFPHTYRYQQHCIQVGKESDPPTNRLAQVADLARIELLYRHGGIYIDSIIEISEAFLQKMEELSETNRYEFIGANEDPCDFNCEGYAKTKYLTNSFMAGPKGSPIFKRLLEPDRLESIDYESQYINRTTGPYYIRSVITDKDIADGKLFLLDSASIYPFNVNETPYKEAHPNKCLYSAMVDDTNTEIEEGERGSENFIKIKDGQYLLKNCTQILQKKGEPLLAVYHSGLGGTWSW
jgi:hypothetical protein